MNPVSEQVFSLLTTNAGSLAYNLVLSFSIIAALLVTLSLRDNSPPEIRRRLLIGLSGLLALRIALFLVAALAWQRLLPSALLLPVLERSADLLGLLIIIWLWAFPQPAPLADFATSILGLVIITFSLLTGLQAINLPLTQPFNGSQLDIFLQVSSLCLAVLGVVLLSVRRPAGWLVGLFMLVILGLGHLFQWLTPTPVGDFPGIIRLAQIMAYPLLIALPFRYTFVEQPLDSPSPVWQAEQPPAAAQPLQEGFFLRILAAKNPQQLDEIAVSSLAELTQSDLCLLVDPPKTGKLFALRSGYDLIHRIKIPSLELEGSFPVLSQAFQQDRVLRLPANSTAPDLRILAAALDLRRSGPLLALPLFTDDRLPLALLVLLSPFSSRNWTAADLNRLAAIAPPLAQILQHNQQVLALADQLSQARQELDIAQDHIQKVELDRNHLRELVSVLEFGSIPAGDFLEEVPAQRSAPNIAQTQNFSEAQEISGTGNGNEWQLESKPSLEDKFRPDG